MVKSRQLKLLRKQLASAIKCPYVVKDHVQLLPPPPPATAAVGDGDAEDLHLLVVTDVVTAAALESCTQLFMRNMAELYRQSSWGLDLDKKQEEWTHKTSRFILLLSHSQPIASSSRSGGGDDDKDASPPRPPQLEAFINYRFVIEDDVEAVVLYVYELQVRTLRRGYGQCLMDAVESIGRWVGLGRVMLTVFRRNTTALSFYRQRLLYQIDETSPDDEDYLILSKDITSATTTAANSGTGRSPNDPKHQR
jgi:N-alpha-acetyltransferase 40